MIENVRGILGAIFEDYRQKLKARFKKMGYHAEWRLLNASDFGVPQLRPRVVILALRRDMALRRDIAEHFTWPTSTGRTPQTVGETLYDLVAERRWKGARAWKNRADDIAPTIVGGSLKHGGPDLGPTRARQAWATLGVDGMGIADNPPGRDYVGMPRLTVPMVSRLQGFPCDWKFSGRKTATYRQVANAFPPPVAQAVAEQIHQCLTVHRLISVAKAAG